MIKVTLQKQTDEQVEFMKEIELQVLPEKKTIITIDGKEYSVWSIKYVDSDIIMTVKERWHNSKNFYVEEK
jgi:hypothetical protein